MKISLLMFSQTAKLQSDLSILLKNRKNKHAGELNMGRHRLLPFFL